MSVSKGVKKFLREELKRKNFWDLMYKCEGFAQRFKYKNNYEPFIK